MNHHTVTLRSEWSITGQRAFRPILSKNRCSTRLPPVSFAFPVGCWLGITDHYRGCKNWSPLLQWILTSQLHDIDFADGIAVLSLTYQQARAKVQALVSMAKLTGLNIEKHQTKIMRINNVSTNPITMENEALEDVRYLHSPIYTVWYLQMVAPSKILRHELVKLNLLSFIMEI